MNNLIGERPMPPETMQELPQSIGVLSIELFADAEAYVNPDNLPRGSTIDTYVTVIDGKKGADLDDD